ncbi:MAG: glycosyltransferase family 2 protein [Verrucomicrobia bacterium]|nr:glycosyltransferase family 2 protein [Verrucomicrobiota bacterium]
MDSRSYLDRHVQGLLPWMDLVQEIIVVDSQSTDGSPEFLKETLGHRNLRVVQHPPGLYASWNYGIAQLQTDFFIMSTTGDTITREGVVRLMDCASQERLDVVLGKPIFEDIRGRKKKYVWPLDDILEDHRRTGPHVAFSGLEAIVHAIGRPNSALLGSSASNLYHTEFFRNRPFPLDWGVAGDGGWVWQHAVEARWGAIPGTHSKFLIHPPQSRREDLKPKLQQRADWTLRESVPRWISSGIISKDQLEAIEFEKLAACLTEYLDAKEDLDAIRKAGVPWVFSPAAWKKRIKRRRAFSALRAAREKSLVSLRSIDSRDAD